MNKVEIWNLALGHLRAGVVQSEIERTAVREYCERYYYVCKKSLLSEGAWSFATTYVALASRSETPEGWAGAFVLPEGYLRVWSVHEKGCGPYEGELGLPFELRYNIDKKATDLVTNIPAPIARVTMDVEESVLPHGIVIALSHLLAANLSVPLAGAAAGARFQKEQMEWYERALAAAHSIDSTDRRQPRRESKSVLARR